MKSQLSPDIKNLKRYVLCRNCTKRLVLKPNQKKFSKPNHSNSKCYICKDIFDTLDSILFNIYDKIEAFDFKTFNLGLTLKNSYMERDDNIKSKFKIKGIGNIKYGISHELSKKISKKTKSKKVSESPDIFLQINLKDNSCTVRSKPIFIYGRYNKKIRKLSQKQKSCKICNGIGCHNCDFIGFTNYESIESKISDFLIKKFVAKQVQINWIGGEDQSSLVLGNGRPFFAKIINAQRRKRLAQKDIDLETVYLSELRKLTVQPKGSISFKSEVSITINTKKLISSKILKNLSHLKNAKITSTSEDKKSNTKKIYDVHYKKLGKTRFLLNLLVDGGIPLKSLVQNSDVDPNISKILGNQCTCEKLDFKNIII